MSAMRRIISPCNSRNLRKTVLGVFSRVPGTSGVPFADDTASEEEEDESFRNSSLSARIATAGLSVHYFAVRTELSIWVNINTLTDGGFKDNSTEGQM